MSNVKEILKETMTIDGAVVVALVDYNTGMTLGTAGDETAVDLNIAAAGNTEVVRAKMRTMEGLKIDDKIEDILITLGGQYHLIRLVAGNEGLFVYLVLDKARANLGMARYRLAALEPNIML